VCSFWQPVQADSQPKSSGLVLGRRPLGAILHSSNEPGELSQWLCHDNSTINIVVVIIIIIIIRDEEIVSTSDASPASYCRVLPFADFNGVLIEPLPVYFETSMTSCNRFYRASAILSVRPSVRLFVPDVPVSDENGLTYCHSFSPYGSPNKHQTYSRNSDEVTPYGGTKYSWGI